MKKLLYAVCAVLTVGLVGYFMVRKTKKFQDFKTKFKETRAGKEVSKFKAEVKTATKDAVNLIKKSIGEKVEVTVETETQDE